MSTGTPDRVWLAMESDIDSSIIHAVFAREADAEAYAGLFGGGVEVYEMAVCPAGEVPPVVTVWTAYADVVMKPHMHGSTPCADRALAFVSASYQPGRETTSAPCEVLRFDMSGCRMTIMLRGTDRELVEARARELYEGRLRARSG